MQLLQLVVVGLLATPQVLARGINCKGNYRCYWGFTPGLKDSASKPQAMVLAQHINSLKDDVWLPAEQQIACFNTICATIHNVEGMYAEEAKNLANEIVRHGCERCGNCPRGYPDTNDSNMGKLSFQREKHMCAKGNPVDTVCPPFWDGLVTKREAAAPPFNVPLPPLLQDTANATYTTFVA